MAFVSCSRHRKEDNCLTKILYHTPRHPHSVGVGAAVGAGFGDDVGNDVGAVVSAEVGVLVNTCEPEKITCFTAIHPQPPWYASIKSKVTCLPAWAPNSADSKVIVSWS